LRLSKVFSTYLTVTYERQVRFRATFKLQEEHAAALKQGLSATFTPSNSLIRVSGGRVSIDAVASGDATALRADLEALGLQKTATFGHMISGLFPISAIGSLAALSSLQFARPAYMTPHVGSVESGGDVSMGSDDARATFGVDGSGITVGTLSIPSPSIRVQPDG
jgi:hypothetical protein